MSDQSTPADEPVGGTVELTAEPEAAKGGLIKGPDGKLSGRKIRANLAYLVGMVFLGIGLFRGGTWLERIAAGAVCFLYALIESGLLTWQNVKEIVAAKAGGVTG